MQWPASIDEVAYCGLSGDVVPFREAGEQFLDWADGEHRDHPATANRLRVSFASLFTFFDNTPVCSIQPVHIDDFKSWRRKCPKCQATNSRAKPARPAADREKEFGRSLYGMTCMH